MRGVWETGWGLLVEDGSLAIGIVAALAVTWLVSTVAEPVRDDVGWLLLAMLVVLVLFNLRSAGQRIRRTRA